MLRKVGNIIYFLAFMLLFPWPQIYGQGECLGSGFCSGGSQFPSGTFSSTTNSWTTVTTLNYAGEYAIYNVTNGSQYEWSLCTSDGGSVSYDAQLTLLNNSTLANICYSDDYCGSNAGGKIQWTATFTGTVRVLITQYNCVTNSTFTTIVWRCSSCGSGTAPANDNCTGATSLTVYGSSCGGATTGNVSGATQSIAAITCDIFTGTANDDIWFKFVATASVTHVVTVTGSASFDPVIDVRSGSCNGANIGCSDATGVGGIETINLSGLTNGSTYYIRIYDYFSGVPATTTFTICVTTPSSCTPYYSNGTTDGDLINRVQLGTIDNTPSGTGSTSGSYYNDYYSSVSAASLQAGTSQTITVTVGTYGGQTVAAWIDYNADNDFSDAGEKLGEVPNVGAGSTATITFTLPVGATVGNTRMRVRTVWSDLTIDPCLTYSYGEAEDYKINITAACTTPGTPASLSTSGITISQATLNWAAGSPSGSTTVTYYWAIGSASNVTYESNYLFRGATTSLNATQASLSPGTTYYWAVKAVTSCNGTASSYASAISFTSGCTTPSTPTFPGTPTTNITTTSATLNWNASTGSPNITYNWFLSTSNGQSCSGGTNGTVSTTSVTVYGLTLNTTYYWTVNATTSCGSGSTSGCAANKNFTTSTIPTPLYTWVGTTSNEWTTASNWDVNLVPDDTKNVLIPNVSAGSNRYPISTFNLSVNNTTATRKCKSLTIDAGASVTLTGGTSIVYISGDVSISGTLNHECGSNSNQFQINSGGKVIVKNGGILNVGSSAVSGGLPGGTINEFNDIQITDGTLEIQSGGKVFIMDELQVTGTVGNGGTLTMSGGELWIKYYGDGSANNLGFNVNVTQYAIINLSGGNIYLCGQDNGASAKMADWNPSATFNITGGTITLMNEQSSGTNNFSGYCNFGGKTIKNLTLNRSAATSYLLNNDLSLNGDLTFTAGTLNANGYNITSAGNWTNNSAATAFTAGTGTVTFTGASKTIGGSFGTNFNILIFNSGSTYTINPSGSSWPDNVAQAQGNFTNSGTITIASAKALDLYGTTNTLNGTITSSSNYDGTRDIDLNTTGNFSSSGTINADLRIYSGTSTLTSNLTLNGNFTIRTGAGFTMSTHNFTDNGSWTNDGTFTSGTGTITFTGSGKSILGSAGSTFNNVVFNTGASYTLNPSYATVPQATFNGNLTVNTGATFTLATTKIINLAGTTTIVDGTLAAADVYDGTRDIGFNNAGGTLSGAGTLNADIQISSGKTTLTSNFDLDGDFFANTGTFEMSTHTLDISGSWTNTGTFTSGTGLVKFSGSGIKKINANGYFSGTANSTADFYDVVIDRGTTSADTLCLYVTPMRVANNLTIKNGVFSTGWKTNTLGDANGAFSAHNRRLTVVKIATIESGGTFFIGYKKACSNSDEGLSSCPISGCSPCLSTCPDYCNADSLNVPVFKGDIINYGSIKTNRPLLSGYSDLKLTGARITGTGASNEFGVDIQPEDGTTVTQVGPVEIQGDLIIQDPSTNLWQNTDPDNTLTIHGNFYLYGSFVHNGIVNVYGNMTSTSNVSNTVSINAGTFNFYQSGTKYLYLDKNPVPFGYVNIKTGTGTRQIRQNISIAKDLTIESGSTLDAYTSNSTINLLGATSSWINNGTFTPQAGTVSFTGSGAQNMSGTSATTFYNLTMANTGSTGVTFNNSGTVTNTLTLTDGILYTSSSKLLTINDQATVSPAGGVAGSYVNGPMKKIGRDGTAGPYSFLFPIGKNSIWARLYLLHWSGTTATNDAFTAEYFYNGYGSDAKNSPLKGVSSLEYWNLTKNSGDAALNKKVRLYSEDKTLSGITAFNNTDLTVGHWNGTKWDDMDNPTSGNNSGNTSPAGWITSSATSTFSPFTFASRSSANPLPVELISFDAKLNSDWVDLFWTTATEINSDFFFVERSLDLESFETVAKIKGAGNSSSKINYLVTDSTPYSGISYYRLKQIDFDGGVTFSKIVPVTIGRSKAEGSKSNSQNEILVYPNPGEGLFYINFENEKEGPFLFMVYDVTGRRVGFMKKMVVAGNALVTMDLRELPAGSYFLVVQSDDHRFFQKVIIGK